MNGPTPWRRLHPMSPVVRGGRATIALLVVLLPSLAGSATGRVPYDLAFLGAVLVLGVVSWLVTRWRVDGDDLQIEMGVLRRQSLRFPLSQVQAIDILQPGLARMFDVAELRLRMGGATGGTARLAYLSRTEAETLRAQFLELAGGAATGPAEVAEAPAEPERVLVAVPTGRLVASILLSDVGFTALAVLVGILVALAYAPDAARAGLGGGGFVWVLSVGTTVWRRFNQEYRLTVADAHDGLRVRAGLVALTAETIRPGRVQAARLVEPFLWRPLGWCRLELDLAGRQRREGEAQAMRRPLRTVLPVGSRALADELLRIVVPGAPADQSRPPLRAFWKSPIRWRMLAWGRSDRCVATTSGRVRRVTSWVPLEKVQSIRRVQGPVQRALRLASVHVDVAGRGVHAVLRDRDVNEADRALVDLVELARTARRRA